MGAGSAVDGEAAGQVAAGRFRSVGWSLGSACPYDCKHCYSRTMRVGDHLLTPSIVERFVAELADVGVRCVTLGGNEPIYTNGLSLRDTQLPSIVRALRTRNIRVALVTSGPSATLLRRLAPDAFAALDMVFVSLDAPTAGRHDENRGAKLFNHAIRAAAAARDAGVETALLYCAHRNNFGSGDVEELVRLAIRTGSRVRINTMKPIGAGVDELVLDPRAYVDGFARLIELCRTDLVDEPVLRALLGLDATGGCPCGVTTFRISHAREDGTIPVAPCIYAANDRVGDLRTDRLADLLQSPAFTAFRSRLRATSDGASACVGGGCASMARMSPRTLGRDPMIVLLSGGARLVEDGLREDESLRKRFGGYLCTWMGTPR